MLEYDEYADMQKILAQHHLRVPHFRHQNKEPHGTTTKKPGWSLSAPHKLNGSGATVFVGRKQLQRTEIQSGRNNFQAKTHLFNIKQLLKYPQPRRRAQHARPRFKRSNAEGVNSAAAA